MSTAENQVPNLASRRDVLKAAAVLTISFWLPRGAGATRQGAEGAAGSMLEPNAFVRIADDGSVTVFAKHLEMGQGVYTGLATIVAEELDADWKNIRVEGAPADAKLYNNLAFGPMQGTGGSSSISNSYDQLRKAGATARALLVTAAAQRWNVPAADVSVTNGIVEHKSSGKQAQFGELVADAAKLPVPADVKLKDPATFRLIGKDAARVDSRAKSTGTATFTQDIHLPGMLTAAVIHPPLYGAKVKGFDATKAKAIRGVRSVVAFETSVRAGVAVLATDFWTAKKAAEMVTVDRDDSAAFKRSSAELFTEYRELAKQPGASAKKVGDVATAFGSAARTL